jgi:flagellar motor switch protein FliM
VRIGDNAGMMNLGIPSIIIKMLRQKFDQQWSFRKTQSTEEEHARILRLVKPATIHLDARLQGPTLTVEDLMKLDKGDILTFDYPLDKPLDISLNGKRKYRGQIVSTGRKRAFAIQEQCRIGE